MGLRPRLMVVRGDGALISAAMVRERPIETILSGPAASIVGARWLTGEADALVSDIGGTTTDVALLRGGLPEIDPQGARVGGFRTMVEAVAMRTTGLGGDSEVHLITDGLEGGLRLGPRRLVPVSLLAVDHGQMVHAALDRWLSADAVGEHDGRFVIPMTGNSGGLGAREAAVLARRDRTDAGGAGADIAAGSGGAGAVGGARFGDGVWRDAVGCQPCAGAAGCLGRGGGGKGGAAIGAAQERAGGTVCPGRRHAGAGDRGSVDAADGGLPAGGGLCRRWRLCSRGARRFGAASVDGGGVGTASRDC